MEGVRAGLTSLWPGAAPRIDVSGSGNEPRATVVRLGAMFPEADPERVFAARRAAVLDRLVRDHGVPREWASAWLESWQGGAADLHDLRRDPTFWEQGYAYALREHGAGHGPPPAPDISSDERDPRL
jgi:hypothetical protein